MILEKLALSRLKSLSTKVKIPGDPDAHYYNDITLNNFETTCLYEKEFKDFLLGIKKSEHLFFIQSKFRSMYQNFEIVYDLLINSSNSFKIICINERCSSNIKFYDNSNYFLPSYDSNHL